MARSTAIAIGALFAVPMLALLGTSAARVAKQTAPLRPPAEALAPRTATPPARPSRAPPRQAAAPAAARPAQPEPFVVRRVLDIPKPFTHGDFYWDEDGVPAGPVIITVDLAAQTLSVFRNGYEIGTAVVLYGADRKPTPTGSFTITQKDADHVSNLYDAPMPYMMRLTNDGVAIHGSPEIHPSYATHGCVGLPIAFARKLFGATKLGTRVIITRGKMLNHGERIIAA